MIGGAPTKTSSTAFGHRVLSIVLKSISAPMDPNSNGMTCAARDTLTLWNIEGYITSPGMLRHENQGHCSVSPAACSTIEPRVLGRARIIQSMASCASAVAPCSGAGPEDRSLGWPMRQRYAAMMACPMQPCQNWKD